MYQHQVPFGALHLQETCVQAVRMQMILFLQAVRMQMILFLQAVRMHNDTAFKSCTHA